MGYPNDTSGLRAFMVLCFGIGALWDGATTALGVAAIIHANDLFGYLMCIVGAVLGFLVGTKLIFSKGQMPFPLLRLLWIVAFAYDIYTAFIGNVQYIILRKQLDGVVAAAHELTTGQLGLAIGLTVLVSASPIMISYLWADE